MLVTDRIRMVNHSVPVLILVGPSNCGKKMVAYRLFDNFFSKWYRKYRCIILPFITGVYQQTDDGSIVYSHSYDVYPKNLWDTLRKELKIKKQKNP